MRRLITMPIAVAALSLGSIFMGASPAAADSSGSVTVFQISCHISGIGGAGGAVVFITQPDGTTMVRGGGSPNLGLCLG
jgi:hypothetical protein